MGDKPPGRENGPGKNLVGNVIADPEARIRFFYTKNSARPRSDFIYTKNFQEGRCDRKWRFYKEETAFAKFVFFAVVSSVEIGGGDLDENGNFL